MIKSLIDWLVRNEVNGSLYEQAIESLIHPICLKHGFIQKWFVACRNIYRIANICIGKTEQKRTMECLKYNKI